MLCIDRLIRKVTNVRNIKYNLLFCNTTWVTDHLIIFLIWKCSTNQIVKLIFISYRKCLLDHLVFSNSFFFQMMHVEQWISLDLTEAFFLECQIKFLLMKLMYQLYKSFSHLQSKCNLNSWVFIDFYQIKLAVQI